MVVIALGSKVGRSEADYLTLADSAVQPTPFEFTELDAGGSVPTVQVKVGLHPLVVLTGETIVGGKQNRIINVSLWLAAQKQTAIPVSCLEHGRWDTGHRFAAGRPVDLHMRAKVSQMVGVHARSATPNLNSDQGAVWKEIEANQQRAAFRSPTAALHDPTNSVLRVVPAARPCDFSIPRGHQSRQRVISDGLLRTATRLDRTSASKHRLRPLDPGIGVRRPAKTGMSSTKAGRQARGSTAP